MNVGDTVKVTNKKCRHFGKVGRIIAIYRQTPGLQPKTVYQVLLTNAIEWPCTIEEIRPLEK